MDKKNILTYEGLKKLEDELEELKVVKRKEVADKIRNSLDKINIVLKDTKNGTVLELK